MLLTRKIPSTPKPASSKPTGHLRDAVDSNYALMALAQTFELRAAALRVGRGLVRRFRYGAVR